MLLSIGAARTLRNVVDDSLTINPQARIFHAEGRFFAGWQPMDKPSVPLSESDFVLLAVLNNTTRRSDVVPTFRANAQTCLPQKISRLTATGRLKELQHAKIILRGASPEPAILDTPAPTSLERLEGDREPSDSLAETVLRVSHNFMLRPVRTGFEIWSSVSRSHHVLSLELALILTFFSSGKRADRLTTRFRGFAGESKGLRAVRWLHDIGLLVAAPKDSKRRSPEVSSAAHKRSAPAIVASTSEPIDLNDRTPIYFVPHMPNHFPLALGMMYSFIKEHNDGALLKTFCPVPIVYTNSPRDILVEQYAKYGPGVWLFSNYMWSVASNLEVSAAVKQHNQHNITIHGGPSTPSYEAACNTFMTQHKSVDIAVHGEGEMTIIELLDSLGSANMDFGHLHTVKGITFRSTSGSANGGRSERFVRTPRRPVIRDLNILPSPYLGGTVDSYGSDMDAAIIESNRGCPFGCTFCDWGSATRQKIRKFDLQRVRDEIEWVGRNRVRVIWVADANFGIYDRDIEIARWICDTRKKYGYPIEVVVNYTKNATKRLAVIVELFAAHDICSQGVISIQTRDPFTLGVINRKNIKTDKYDDLAEIFRVAGLPLSTDLMIGLPGMTIDSFKKDLQYFFEKDVTVKAYATELLPNSPMADPDYMEKYEIKVDRNNFLKSTFSYSTDDLHVMNMIFNLFSVADNFSTLRYVLRYLHWDHGIAALDFLHELYNELERHPYKYPALTYASKVFMHYLNVPGGWNEFYNEIADFSEKKYDVRRDSAFDAALHYNEMVMPDDAFSYPLEVQLKHDVPAYFRDHNLKDDQGKRPLAEYPSARLTIYNKYAYGHINYNREQYDSHQVFWELQSPTARIQSVPNFV